MVVVGLIFYLMRKPKEIDSNKNLQAKMIVNQARTQGYSDYGIRKMFEEKGWSKSEIDFLLK
jgi:hypothetical protein